MTVVMIGIDPHKGSHTAVAINAGEAPLGRVWVPACPDQAGRLLAWAQGWPERTWAVEGATGLGHLLAQQLVAAGERVLDIQPKLAARIRVLEAGNTSNSSGLTTGWAVVQSADGTSGRAGRTGPATVSAAAW